MCFSLNYARLLGYTHISLFFGVETHCTIFCQKFLHNRADLFHIPINIYWEMPY